MYQIGSILAIRTICKMGELWILFIVLWLLSLLMQMATLGYKKIKNWNKEPKTGEGERSLDQWPPNVLFR